MNILLLGSGGREHAMAWKIRQSRRLGNLYIAPGNAGTSLVGKNVDLSLDDFPGIGRFAVDNQIDMVVVGPEDPLVKGIVDYFHRDSKLKNIAIIGPSRKAAQMEGSKEFAKAFMMRHQIPTARYKSVTLDTLNEGLEFLETLAAPYVLKADGLAAGKGVLILQDPEEARSELKQMLSGKFGGKVPAEPELLMHLPGVGRKTANVVASVIFRKPVMAVDTHVLRVSQRIGLAPGAKTPLEAERILTANIPDDLMHNAHHWLILHGRYVCKARKPLCEECGLKQLCLYYSVKNKTK